MITRSSQWIFNPMRYTGNKIIFYDNTVGHFSMSGKPLSSCTSELNFRLHLDLGETRRF